MNIVKDTVQKVMKKVIEKAPDAWMPHNAPDPLSASHGGLIGAPVSRVDGALKVQGQAPYAAEFTFQNMAYAALAYSTVAKGRIATLDTAAAQGAPGVVLVLSHKNAMKMAPMPLFLTADKAMGGEALPVMQDDKIYWNGQPVALVLAESQEQAEHAASLIVATYDTAPAVTSLDTAIANGTTPATFQGEPLKLDLNDAEAALQAAPFQVDVQYDTPRHNHNALELHAATLAWDGDDLRIHDAAQGVAHMAWSMAQVFGIKAEQVRVTSPFVGGAFGGKSLWRHHVLAAAAAKMAGRPVRIMLSRAGVYHVVGGRAPTRQRVALGAQADGTFDAIIHTGVVAMTAHNALPEPVILGTRCMYAAGAFKLDVETAEMDMLANTFMRAPGEAVGTFALESAVDELAYKLGMDPIALRLRNEPAQDPTAGTPFSSRHLVEAYRMGAERFGWRNRHAQPRMRVEGEWLVGMGCASATYPYYRMPGGAARLTLSQDSRVRVEIAAHDMGMGTATVQAQVTAERLGLPLAQVTVAYGDTDFPGVVLAGGSQQTASIGSAVTAASGALVAALLKLADRDSPLHGLTPDDVLARDGGLSQRGEPQRFETYAALLARGKQASLTVEAAAPPPFEFMHWSMHSFGAIFCEARVNMVTGEPRISRLLGAFDCGRILNAKTAASQFKGGMIMGMGLALMEETRFDPRNGRIMNPSLAEYHVPVHLDVPEIDVLWTDIPDPHAPMGAHGVGEIGITGTGAAIANAIYNTCGKRVRSLPITLDKLLDF